MNSFIDKLEHMVARLAEWVVRRPHAALWGILAFIALMSAGMSRLYIDVTNESMFKAGDPTLQYLKRFQTQFGRDDAALAAISSTELFTPQFLERLEAYHHDLEKSVPYLDEVISLVNVTSVTDSNGELLIDDLRNVWPRNPDDLPAFKKYVLNNPLYRNLIISEDGNTTLMVVRASAFAVAAEPVATEKKKTFRDRLIAWHESLFGKFPGETNAPETPAAGGDVQLDLGDLPAELATSVKSAGKAAEQQPLTMHQIDEFVAAVREVTQRHSTADFPIKLAGSQMIAIEHAESIHSDFMGLLPITFALVLAILLVMMRRWSAVIMPILVVTLSLIATFGFMGWLGMPVTPVAVAIPPILLAIGTADAVHFISVYYSHYNKTGDCKESVLHAAHRTGVAVFFTSMTTVAGFLSFITASIKPIADFGILLGFGVFVALLLTLLLIPALLVINQGGAKQAEFIQRWQRLVDAMSRVAEFSINNPARISIVLVAIILACIPGIMRLEFSHNTLEWFEESRPVRVNTLEIDEKFHGSIPLEMILDTGRPNGIYSPDFMRKLDEFAHYTEGLRPHNVEMGRTTSVVDTLKRIHSVMNGEMPATPIPEDESLVAQELLLFESSGASDVQKLIDSNFSLVRVTVRLSWTDAVDYLPMRQQITAKAVELFGDTATVTVTGTIDLISRALVALIQSMTSSYLISTLSIALMMIVLLRSLSLGLVSLVPNILPIAVALAIMGYCDRPIDMFSVMLGGIALGLVVDDTVHVMHGYRYYRHEMNHSMQDSIAQTIQSTGPAVFFNTLAMALGFMVFVFSTISALQFFGILLCLTIFGALAVDLLVTPAMIRLVDQLGWFSAAEKGYGAQEG